MLLWVFEFLRGGELSEVTKFAIELVTMRKI